MNLLSYRYLQLFSVNAAYNYGERSMISLIHSLKPLNRTLQGRRLREGSIGIKWLRRNIAAAGIRRKLLLSTARAIFTQGIFAKRGQLQWLEWLQVFEWNKPKMLCIKKQLWTMFRSVAKLGSGLGNPGSIPSLCKSLSFFPSKSVREIKLRRPPIEFQLYDKNHLELGATICVKQDDLIQYPASCLLTIFSDSFTCHHHHLPAHPKTHPELKRFCAWFPSSSWFPF